MQQRLFQWQGGGRHARGNPSRVGTARSVRSGVAVALLVPHLAGCFHYVPAGAAPLPGGTEVSVGITDRGRVALTEDVGPGVRRIGGRLLESTDTSIALAVTSVQYLDLDITARWAGERVELSRDHVGEIRERRLSRSRTWAAVGLAAAGLVASTLIAISGFGTDTGSNVPPGDGQGQQ